MNAAGYVVWPTARGTASTAGPYHRPRQTMAARLIRRYVRERTQYATCR